jgi:hypothetical protein
MARGPLGTFLDPEDCPKALTAGGKHDPSTPHGKRCGWCGRIVPPVGGAPNPVTETDYEARARQLEEGQ